MIDIKNIKTRFFNNRKVAENYFFMTLTQGASLLIGLLIYPYLIRTLGAEIYGKYVFIFSNIQFFSIFISFGFAFPALKKISLFPDDISVKSRTISEVFTAQIYLFFLSGIILSTLIFSVPFVHENAIFYIIIFMFSLIEILFPIWYFQGIQKMKFVTYLNLSVKISTIPFIFIFVKSPSDLLKYTFIATLLPVSGSIFTFFYLQIKEKIKISFVSFRSLKPVFRDALPFFWTSAFSVMKKETLTFFIGTFFSMESVAFYDLANKIVSIPRVIVNSINSALFPKVVRNHNLENIKKIIKYETIIGLIISGLIAAFGYWAVLILGGKNMVSAYPLAIILSFTIYSWLIVGSYINFIFVPNGKYYFVTKNQFAALVSFLIFSMIGILISKNVFILVLAYVLSHVVEIVYCRYLIKKNKLL